MRTQPLEAAGEAEVDDEWEACHALLDDLTPLPSPVRVAARSLQLQEDEVNRQGAAMDSFEKIKVQWGKLESQAHLGPGRQNKELENLRKNNNWMLDPFGVVHRPETVNQRRGGQSARTRIGKESRVPASVCC